MLAWALAAPATRRRRNGAGPIVSVLAAWVPTCVRPTCTLHTCRPAPPRPRAPPQVDLRIAAMYEDVLVASPEERQLGTELRQKCLLVQETVLKVWGACVWGGACAFCMYVCGGGGLKVCGCGDGVAGRVWGSRHSRC